METTVFEHDGCDTCTYLGPYGPDEGSVTHDLWFCPQSGRPTVMARYGNEGWEYLSGIESTQPPMLEAQRRARSRGLL